MSNLSQTCQCCGKALKRSEAGAMAWTGDNVQVWCMPCWDTDPRALQQYQATSVRWDLLLDDAALSEV